MQNQFLFDIQMKKNALIIQAIALVLILISIVNLKTTLIVIERFLVECRK